MNLKSGGKLNPVQLKKSYRPSGQRTIIDCEKSTSSLQSQYNDVYLFLKDLNMENYLENFIKNGINSEEKILYLNNDNLKLINVPYAHRVRFLKKLKEIQTMQLMKKTFNETGELGKIKKRVESSNSKYEEIFIPKEEDDIEVGDDEQRKTFTQAIYDFQKSHSQFEDLDNKIITIKKSNNNSNDNKNKNKNNIISNNNNKISTDTNTPIKETPVEENEKIEKEVNPPVEVGEYVENKITEIVNYNNDTSKSEVKQFFPINSPKTLCYQCFHMILKNNCIHKYDKPFCSLHCLDVYQSKNITSCKYCQKKIIISDSIPSLLKEKEYYCSNICKEKGEPNGNKIFNTSQVMDSVSPSSSDASENVIDILDL